ncbi:unnamed protein product [Sphagnum balticum]
MVGGGGGGTRRGDDGSSAALLSTTNIFAALESRRRSSKSSKKKKDESKEKQSASKSETENLITEPVQFWAPSQVTVKSWADCDDDDEDYYATTAPPPEEHSPELTHTDPEIRLNQEEGSEDDEGEEEEQGFEDDLDNDKESEENGELSGTSAGNMEMPALEKKPDRQLSKKELKKKGLAELEAVLAEFGLSQTDENGDEIFDENNEEPENKQIGGEYPSPVGSKSSKRRKAKKEKSFKDADVPLTPSSEAGIREEDSSVADLGDAVTTDPKEVLRRLATLKKKKSMKDADAAAKAAASEAAARAARLAAAKKKEKTHYNQQPVR